MNQRLKYFHNGGTRKLKVRYSLSKRVPWDGTSERVILGKSMVRKAAMIKKRSRDKPGEYGNRGECIWPGPSSLKSRGKKAFWSLNRPHVKPGKNSPAFGVWIIRRRLGWEKRGG